MVDTLDLQRKYRYKIELKVNSTGVVHNALVDEFTPPERRAESITRQNKRLGQITLTGPVSYGEMTFRVALRIGSDAEASAVQNLIAALEDLHLADTDTCDIALTLATLQSAQDAASFTQTFSNCKLLSYKLDGLSRKADDDFVHIEIVLIPTHIDKVNAL